MAKKNLIVGQSGGPTAVINSSLYGVVSEGLNHNEEIETVYGMVNGIRAFWRTGSSISVRLFPVKRWNILKPPPEHIWVPAVINCRNPWRIPFIPGFLKNLKN